MRRALIVMAKRPKAGTTKTRLTPALSPEGAAQLYQAMLYDIVSNLSRRTDAEVLIASADAADVSWFEETFPGVPVVVQVGATLGERLDHVLSTALEAGYEAAFAISSDSPDLPEGHLTDAFALLDDGAVDALLGPTEDGGYWLIGWKQRWTPMVVDVKMSRSDVLENTLRIAAGLGANAVCAKEWYDVDHVEDVERLLSGLDKVRLPKTAAALTTVGFRVH